MGCINLLRFLLVIMLAVCEEVLQYAPCVQDRPHSVALPSLPGMWLHLIGVSAARVLKKAASADELDLQVRAAMFTTWNETRGLKFQQRALEKVAQMPNLPSAGTADIRRYFTCGAHSIIGFVRGVSFRAMCDDLGDGSGDSQSFPGAVLEGHVPGAWVQGPPQDLMIGGSLPKNVLNQCVNGNFVLSIKLSFGKKRLRSKAQGSIAGPAERLFDVELPVNMCGSVHKKRSVTVCTQPLYDRTTMSEAHPGFFVDWLQYHYLVGVEHFFVYDIDGSFEATQAFAKNGRASYYPFWAHRLASSMARMTKLAPLCTENFAYTHCALMNFLVSDWVLLLHAPDEYLDFPASWRKGDTRALANAIGPYEAMRAEIAILHIATLPFAQLESCALPLPKGSGQGSLVRCSSGRARSMDELRFPPLVNPENCGLVGAFGCYILQGRKLFIAQSVMRINHYVEFLPRDAGRCARISKLPCNVTDRLLAKFFVRSYSQIAGPLADKTNKKQCVDASCDT